MYIIIAHGRETLESTVYSPTHVNNQRPSALCLNSLNALCFHGFDGAWAHRLSRTEVAELRDRLDAWLNTGRLSMED